MNLYIQGQSISNAIQWAAITYVYTPRVRATHIKCSGVAASGATDLTIK